MELLTYILVPFFIALLFKKLMLTKKSLTYLLTTFIILIYPFLLFSLEDFLNFADQKSRCGNIQGLFVIGNTLIYLPVALLLQYFFNKWLVKIKNTND